MNKLQISFRIATAIAFIGTGIFHFIRPDLFARIVPPMFPHPRALVFISGICEIAGATGLLIPRLRRPAAWGLIALLIAVFPANIYMAVEPDGFKDLKLPTWFLWLRLPMQPVFIAAVWWFGLKREPAFRPDLRT
jgi:uncharacterized membrane protein